MILQTENIFLGSDSERDFRLPRSAIPSIVWKCYLHALLVSTDLYEDGDVAAAGQTSTVVHRLDAESVRGSLLVVHVPHGADLPGSPVHAEAAEDVAAHQVVVDQPVVSGVAVSGLDTPHERAHRRVLHHGEAYLPRLEQGVLVVGIKN